MYVGRVEIFLAVAGLLCIQPGSLRPERGKLNNIMRLFSPGCSNLGSKSELGGLVISATGPANAWVSCGARAIV